MPIDDRGERADPGDRVVALVPEEREPPPAAEGAVQLAERAPAVEPVERGGGAHGVHAVPPDREQLRDRPDREDPRAAGLAHHRRGGLERDRGRAARRGEARELAGARPEVEERPAGAEREEPHEQVHRLGGVIGSRAVVQVGGRVESAGGVVLDHPRTLRLPPPPGEARPAAPGAPVIGYNPAA